VHRYACLVLDWANVKIPTDSSFFILQRERDNESYFREWVEEFGVEGAKVVRDAVEAQVEDYNYLKQFALMCLAASTT
jgi:hypothetical protein